MNLAERWRLELDGLERAGRFRTLTPPAGIDFSSNDYLGYGKRSSLMCDLSRSGMASRLLRGHDPIWDEVETRLAAWHRAETALVMTSGYVANEGLLSTVIEPGDTVFSDQYNHASIIDGLRLSKADRVVFPHNDVNQLESLMRSRVAMRNANEAWFIVTESLFGMEGDQAPLPQLTDLAERYRAHLIVDEAHATGCFGLMGGGLIDHFHMRDRVLATVHTGGKALGAPGAYIVGSRLLTEMMVNRCRHFIFTTALPPAFGAWWLDTLERVASDDAARVRLHANARYFRAALAERGIIAGGSEYIVSLLLGADATAVAAAEKLQDAGFDIRAIRPPTVPEDTARLRVSVHADHHQEELRNLSEALAHCFATGP